MNGILVGYSYLFRIQRYTQAVFVYVLRWAWWW